MALDPSISLQGLGAQSQTFNPMETVLNYAKLGQIQQGMAASQQQIAASKAAQAISEAQLPGVQAESAIKQRDAEFNKFLKDNAGQFYDTDEKTGIQVFNPSKAADAAAKAGYLDKARSGLASDLSNQWQTISNAQGNIRTQNDAVDLGNKILKLQNDSVGHVANILDNTPLAERDQQLQTLTGGLDKLIPGSDLGKSIISKLGTPKPVLDANGQPVIDQKTGQPQVTIVANPTAIAAYKKASIDAATQNSQLLARQEAEKRWELTSQSPAAYATSGPEINAAYTALRSAGIGEDKVPSGLSLNALKQLGYGEIVKDAVVSNMAPAATRQDYLNKYTEAQKDIAATNNAINVVSKANTDLLGTRPGSIASGAFIKWVSQNPAYRSVETAVTRHNAMYPNDQIDPSTMTLREIGAKLQGTLINRRSDAEVYLNAAKTQELPTNAPAGGVPSAERPAGVPVPGGVQNPPATRTPKSNAVTRADGKVLMKGPNGKTGFVSPSGVAEAERQGWSRVSK
jgi:hypothetical protein